MAIAQTNPPAATATPAIPRGPRRFLQPVVGARREEHPEGNDHEPERHRASVASRPRVVGSVDLGSVTNELDERVDEKVGSGDTTVVVDRGMAQLGVGEQRSQVMLTAGWGRCRRVG